MGVKQRVFKSAQRNGAELEPLAADGQIFCSWSPHETLWTALNTLRQRGSEDLLVQENESLAIFVFLFLSLWISLSLCVSPSVSSRSVALSQSLFLSLLCPLFLSQGGSTAMNVTPVPMLLRGNWLLSLGAVGSHMLMFSYSREMRRGSRKDC